MLGLDDAGLRGLRLLNELLTISQALRPHRYLTRRGSQCGRVRVCQMFAERPLRRPSGMTWEQTKTPYYRGLCLWPVLGSNQ